MFENVYIQQVACYQPPADNPKDAPKLAYVDPLFKRRLSQLSRMTIEAVHGVLEAAPDEAAAAKLVFASRRGEITRQLKINRGLVEDGDVLPAQFSLSVFNTPPAVATIALGLKAGYTAVYPDQSTGRGFYDALMAAIAPLLVGKAAHVIFVYGDELVPSEYATVATETEQAFAPFACAVLLSTKKTTGALDLSAVLAAVSDKGAFADDAAANDSASVDTTPLTPTFACGDAEMTIGGEVPCAGDTAPSTVCVTCVDAAACTAISPEAFFAYVQAHMPTTHSAVGAAHE